MEVAHPYCGSISCYCVVWRGVVFLFSNFVALIAKINLYFGAWPAHLAYYTGFFYVTISID